MPSDAIKTFIMGSVSGTISTVLFQPLDVTKTRLQDVSKRGTGVKINYIFVFKNIYHTDGITGFWKGLSPSLMRSVPGVGMYFCTLHFLNENLEKKPTVFHAIMMGAIARTSSTVCLIPFSVLKTRFESGEYNYRGLFHALQEVYRTEGFRGFSRGLTPTIIRDVPFSGIYYLFYSRLKRLAGLEDSDSKSSLQIFIFGITAGCLASLITHPADVIKTYMQLYPNEFSNLSSGLHFIYKKFGVAGYFKGLIVRLVRKTLVTSLSWTVYERINEWNKMNEF